MKRSAAADADGGVPPIKRRKPDVSDAAVNADDPSTAGDDANDPFRPTLQRKATDICQTGVDQTGFIKGNVIMRWPIRNDTNRIVVEAVEDGRKVKFEVEFSGLSFKFLDGKGVTIAVGGQLYLSLRGATLKDKQSSQGNYLPKIFQYSEGTALKYIGKGTPREEVQLDYWADHPPQPQQEEDNRNTGDAPFGDDWFATPAGPAPTTEKPVPEASHSQIAEPVPVGSGLHPAASSDPKVQAAIHVENPLPKPLEESPAEKPPEVKSVLPPKRLYRSVGGRPTPGNLRNAAALSSTHIDTTNEARPAPAPPTAGNAVAGPSTIPVEGLPNKVQKKAQKKAAREAKRAAREQGNGIPPVAQAEDAPKLPQFQTAKAVHLAAIASASASGSTTPAPPSPAKPIPPPTTPAKVVPPNRSIPPSPTRTRLTSSQQTPASDLDLVAGCHSLQGVAFRPLNDLTPGFEPVSIIAVLAVINPVNTTTTQEQCRRVIVVDPSNVNMDNPIDGFSINLFAKKASDLPDGKPGDVLLLHGLQVANYQGRKSGVCPSYKTWSWAVFAPETGNTTRSPVSGAAGSFGLSTELGPPELKYCIALGDWWRAVSKEHQRKLQESGVTVHQLQDVQQRTAGRVHRLIQDAAPDAPPSGYFNSTVEVLYGHENTNGVYSLYVTDYTKNENLYPIQANWCTPAYEGYAFKIDMWNEAALEAPKLQPHDYYEINNVRMKLSTGGYWEGSFSEVRKMRKLDEDELEGEPKLAALLERKKKWEEEVEQHGGHKFPHKLFQEAELDKHFCATVEILRISTKDNDRVLLFVTDYTARQDLAPIAATADWTQDIDPDRIVKIALFNLQAKTAADLRAGDIVAIRNLRLKALSGGVNVVGQVGGNDRLIYKLDPKTTGNEDCIALLGRKKAWEKRLQERQAARERDSNTKKAAKGKTKANGFVPKFKGQAAKVPEVEVVRQEASDVMDVEVPDVPQSQPEEPTKRLPDRPAGAVTLKSILDAEASTIAKYRVVARISDFYPMRVEDFVVLHCTNCGKDIPEQYRICTTCDEDMMDTHVRPFFRFHFELEDEEGTRLQVLVAHNEWPHVPDILQDLEPVDFNEDPDALEEFRAKLRPILGELLDKHEELVEDSEEGSPAADTPLCNIVIGATPATDSRERRFCLWSCAPLG